MPKILFITCRRNYTYKFANKAKVLPKGFVEKLRLSLCNLGNPIRAGGHRRGQQGHRGHAQQGHQHRNSCHLLNITVVIIHQTAGILSTFIVAR